MSESKPLLEIMLDSGAFSAWNQGTSVDLKAYIKYIKTHQHLLFSYVVLDVLPPGKESLRTKEAIETGAKQSYANLQTMKDAGLKPIPVFHQGENFKWLEKMLADGEPYIGISAIKSQWNKQIFQRKWLDEVFAIITNSKGEPIVHTHGFGITSVKLLFRYPWYTVDSTTWSKAAGYGRILVPQYVGGKPDYSKLPIQVAVSGVNKYGSSSPKWRKSKRGYFEGLGPEAQDHVIQFLEEEAKITLPEVRHSSHARRQVLLIYYSKLCESASRTNYAKRRSMFDHHQSKQSGIKREPLRMMFATTIENPSWAHLMKEINIRDQLLSYYNLKDYPDELLEKYAMTGMAKEWEKQIPKQDWESDTYKNFRCMKILERKKNGTSQPSLETESS